MGLNTYIKSKELNKPTTILKKITQEDISDFYNKDKTTFEQVAVLEKEDVKALIKFVFMASNQIYLAKVCEPNSKPELTVANFKNCIPLLEEACRLLWRNAIITNDYEQGFIDYIRGIRKLRVQCPSLLDKAITDAFEVVKKIKSGIEERKAKKDNAAKEGEKNKKHPSWDNRGPQYEAMLKAGIMKTDYEDDNSDNKYDTVLCILKGYYDIRNVRNHVNHALEKDNNNKGMQSETELQKQNEEIRRALNEHLNKIEETIWPSETEPHSAD